MASASKWPERADVISKLLLPVVLAGIGYFVSKALNNSQDRAADLRIYTELETKREEADSSLRHAMFESALKTFLESHPPRVERDIVNLELLAHNFHETINLRPLFLQVKDEIAATPASVREVLSDRLTTLATEITDEELRVLASYGAVAKIDFDLDIKDYRTSRSGVASIDLRQSAVNPMGQTSSGPLIKADDLRSFTVHLQNADSNSGQLGIWLEVWAPNDATSEEVNYTFDAGYFDFPMVENIRLSHGQRCAVVVQEISESVARISLVFFPGSRASLKDKPYYDEVLDELASVEKGRRK